MSQTVFNIGLASTSLEFYLWSIPDPLVQLVWRSDFLFSDFDVGRDILFTLCIPKLTNRMKVDYRYLTTYNKNITWTLQQWPLAWVYGLYQVAIVLSPFVNSKLLINARASKHSTALHICCDILNSKLISYEQIQLKNAHPYRVLRSAKHT